MDINNQLILMPDHDNRKIVQRINNCAGMVRQQTNIILMNVKRKAKYFNILEQQGNSMFQVEA